MPPDSFMVSERSPHRLAARGLFVMLLVAAAIPGYLVLTPAMRPVAVRLACALIVIVGCVRVTRAVKRALGPRAPSALDARPSPPPAPELDGRFLRTRRDLVVSTRSRQYFDAILWPRLLELAGNDLPRPANRRGIFRRGPALRALERLVTEAERRA
jgi:hypothetical protein